MQVLALNAGSSSLKYKLISVDPLNSSGSAVERQSGEVERTGTPAQAAETVVDRLLASGCRFDAIGYRVVHGGNSFRQATLVTPDILSRIRALGELAPLHNPVEADMIEAGIKRLPSVPAVAVFDTAFHSTLPETAYTYALPADLRLNDGLRRYGFHGISYRHASQRLYALWERGPAGTRVVACHLGSGASVCAIQDGRSIDTSMGMTPLEGLVMGTRSGDIDPGILLYLLREKRMSPDLLDDLLNHRSGLKGISGNSADVRDLEQAARDGDAGAALALEVFAYRVRKYVGAYAAAMGGLDAIVFTAGIGEHSPDMRLRICRNLDFLGVRLDPERNLMPGRRDWAISEPEAPVAVWVIAADEESQIARETAEVLGPNGTETTKVGS